MGSKQNLAKKQWYTVTDDKVWPVPNKALQRSNGTQSPMTESGRFQTKHCKEAMVHIPRWQSLAGSKQSIAKKQWYTFTDDKRYHSLSAANKWGKIHSSEGWNWNHHTFHHSTQEHIVVRPKFCGTITERGLQLQAEGPDWLSSAHYKVWFRLPNISWDYWGIWKAEIYKLCFLVSSVSYTHLTLPTKLSV